MGATGMIAEQDHGEARRRWQTARKRGLGPWID
jgi:hypothetical protein